MGLESDAVTETVGEGISVAGGLDDVASDTVEIVIGGSGAGGVDGGLTS